MRGNKRSTVLWLASLLVAVGTPPLQAAFSPPNSDTQPQPGSVAAPVPSDLPGIPRAAERNSAEIAHPPAMVRAARELDTSRIDHLRRAERHLRAAGKTKLAGEIAREVKIEEKLVQIRKLQAEVAQLGSTAASAPAIRVQVSIVELQVDRMRKAGFDAPAPRPMDSTQLVIGKPIDSETLEEFLAALKQDGFVKVLAEPTLITLSGRPASLHTGGELPVKVPQSLGGESLEYLQLGTRIDCLPTLLDDGRIRLELRATVREIEISSSSATDDSGAPAVRSRCIDTTIQMESGQTVVLGGITQRRPEGAHEDGQTRLLVFVTAEAAGPCPSGTR